MTREEYSTYWKQWIGIAERQRYVTDYLFPDILQYFSKKQKILELGAGVGQLCKVANTSGYSVLGSDYCDNFVSYMRENNMTAVKIDALNIEHNTQNTSFDGIYAQGLSVLVTKDEEIISCTYRSIYKALTPKGRFIFIFPRGSKIKYSRASEHEKIYSNIGFKKIHSFRQQAFPAFLYKYRIIRFFEKFLGSFFGIRDIIILEKGTC